MLIFQCLYIDMGTVFFKDDRCRVQPRELTPILGMGVSTTQESGATFPTRILNPDIYWGISPVKSQFRPDDDPLKFDVGFLFPKNLATPEKYWAKSADFSVFGRGSLRFIRFT